MGAPCALCKGRKPHRTHVFPQNSRAEVQLKWVKALGLPQEKEDAVLAEMRQMEEKGSRPRWCTFHFEYDSSDIHFPKYFDPEEGKAAQGWKEEEEEGPGPSSTGDEADSPRDRSSTPNEPRRSSRKRPAVPSAPSPSAPETLELSLQKILADAGISIPGMVDEKESSKPSTSKKREEKATSVEKTLQNILMGAGLPVPETLQAKTGVIVEEDSDTPAIPSRPFRQTTIRAAMNAKKTPNTVNEVRRAGTFCSVGAIRGGSTLSIPKKLTNPIATKHVGEYPVIIPKQVATRLPVSNYNHNTMEKYDDSDSLRDFKMPCKEKNCRSELTVIMNRARALEEHFDELSNNVLNLVQMYKNKEPLAYRPPQNLATIQGRAAAVAGPVYARPVPPGMREIPYDSLAVQERREKRSVAGMSKKEPERLLTDDDLASTVRKRLKEEPTSGDEEGESTEKDEEESEKEEEWRPPSSKRRRIPSKDVYSSSEASPPTLDMIE